MSSKNVNDKCKIEIINNNFRNINLYYKYIVHES